MSKRTFIIFREYILHRDNHKCQNPDCKNKDKNPILELHHIIFKSDGGSDSPNNLDHSYVLNVIHLKITKVFLKNWKPKIKGLKGATFMSSIRWKLVNALKCKHTYGYITKSKRIEEGIEKSPCK